MDHRSTNNAITLHVKQKLHLHAHLENYKIKFILFYNLYFSAGQPPVTPEGEQSSLVECNLTRIPQTHQRAPNPRVQHQHSLRGHKTTWHVFAAVLLYRCSHGWNAWAFPPFVLPSRALPGIPIPCVKFFLFFFLFIPDCTEIQDGNAIRRFCSLIWTGKLWKSLHIKTVYEKEMKILGIPLQYKV